MDNITETKIDGKVYHVIAECSPTATETVVKKLERLISRHVLDTKSYQINSGKPLDMCEIVREHGLTTINKE